MSMVLATICEYFLARIEDKYSRNLHSQYVNSANRFPCDVIKKMADFKEDGNRKLQRFTYFNVGLTTLSISIGHLPKK